MMALAHQDAERSRAPRYEEGPPSIDQLCSENSLRVLVPHTVVQTKRLLIRWGRDVTTVVYALILPILFLVAVNTVFGRQISSISGHSALYGSVPMAALVATIFGSSVGGIGLMRERADGLLARLWVMPVHRASGLLSRIIAEAVRIQITTLVILCAGIMLGLRFHQGLLAFLAWLMVPVIFGVAFATLVTTVALYSAKTTLVEAISLLNMLALFFCTGFVPLGQYPQWIQPVVEQQPMSHAIEAMRGLSLGGPSRWPVTATLLWAGGIIAVCVLPMAFGYRKASMR
jgi:ABC-2 type transport system permease protein